MRKLWGVWKATQPHDLAILIVLYWRPAIVEEGANRGCDPNS